MAPGGIEEEELSQDPLYDSFDYDTMSDQARTTRRIVLVGWVAGQKREAEINKFYTYLLIRVSTMSKHLSSIIVESCLVSVSQPAAKKSRRLLSITDINIGRVVQNGFRIRYTSLISH